MGNNVSRRRRKDSTAISLPYLNEEATIALKSYSANLHAPFQLPHNRFVNAIVKPTPHNTNNGTNSNTLAIKIALIFSEDDLDIDAGDSISQTTTDIILGICSYLSIEDICTIQRVSRFWCKTWEANCMWKVVVRRESINWTMKAHEHVLKCMRMEAEGKDTVRWKDLLKDYYRGRDCCKCGGMYRLCYNTAMACVRHSGIRDLVEDRGIPSGVYWLCCLEKQKSAPGCTVGSHTAALPN